MSRDQTKQIVKSLGGPYALAEAINAIAEKEKDRITPQAISLWMRVPVSRCAQLEQISNGALTCHQLRPDVFKAPKAAA